MALLDVLERRFDGIPAGFLSIAALGNQVPQLHVHVIARWRTDAAWPKPVWGVKPPLAYAGGQQVILLNSLRQLLKLSGLAGIDR